MWSGLALWTASWLWFSSPQALKQDPVIVDKPINFDEERVALTLAYRRAHQDPDAQDIDIVPRMIVLHHTSGSSFKGTWSYFDDVHVEEGRKRTAGAGDVNVSAHFVVDRDGTIYRLVRPTTMCRHTVGLNYTAIGIEHVGMSDTEVMADRRQLAASLRLTRALQGRYGIATKNVIGHNESLSSPYHRENVARLRTQTHSDFPKAVMNGYRRRLGRLPAPASLR